MTKEKNKVKQVRIQLELGQQEFADSLKVSKSIIAKAESGNATISESLVSKICNKFGVNREFFESDAELILSGKGSDSTNPWKDALVYKLNEDAKKWEEKYDKLWARFETLLDRVQGQMGKHKALSYAGTSNKKVQARA